MSKKLKKQAIWDTYNKELGKRIRHWRDIRGMTQAQLELKLAEKLTGLSETELINQYDGRLFNGYTISRYEHGERAMDTKTLFALAAALDVTLDELAPEHFRKDVDLDQMASAEVLDTFYGLDTLNKENLERVRHYINVLSYSQQQP